MVHCLVYSASSSPRRDTVSKIKSWLLRNETRVYLWLPQEHSFTYMQAQKHTQPCSTCMHMNPTHICIYKKMLIMLVSKTSKMFVHIKYDLSCNKKNRGLKRKYKAEDWQIKLEENIPK